MGGKHRLISAVCGGLMLTASSCASYSLIDPNGNKVSGSMMNGAASISSGDACTPTVPSPAVPPPPVNFPTSVTPQLVCDPNGQNCRAALMSMRATNTPVCNTSVVNVRGTDLTTIATYLLAAGLGAFALAK